MTPRSDALRLFSLFFSLFVFGTAANALTPVITGVSPVGGFYGQPSPLTITGTNFGSSGTVTFNGVTASIVGWSSTSIAAYIPAQAMEVTVVVTTGGVQSNGFIYNENLTPVLASLSPASGHAGSILTISGPNLGACGTLFMTVGQYPSPVSATFGSTIVATVPAGAATGPLFVLCGGYQTNSLTFTVSQSPNITGISPSGGFYPEAIQINGANFGSSGTVTFNGMSATTFNWTNTSIGVSIPAEASTATVVVTAGGTASNSFSYTESPTPSIASLSPTAGAVGSTVTITGTNLGACQNLSGSMFASTFGPTTVVATVQPGSVTGPVYANCSGYSTNELNFTVLQPTSVAILVSPNPSTYGTPTVINATVTAPSGGTPTGTVGFYAGGTLLGSSTLSSGSASIVTSALNAGTTSVTADYSGDASYITATASTSFTVSPATPTLSFTPIGNQTYMASLLVSASSASSGAITYTVTSGPATIAGSTVTMNGSGTVMLSASQAATANYTAATASTSFTVSPPTPTLLTLIASPGLTVSNGTTVQLIGSLSTNMSTANMATGTISFYDSGALLGSGPVSDGQASISTGTLAAGTHSITAAYTGDGTFSTSSAIMWPETLTVKAQNAPLLPAYGYINTLDGSGLHWPMAVAVDGGGNIYIVDDDNNRVLKVAATTGVVTTVAGNGVGAGQIGPGASYNQFNGDNIPATSANLNSPEGLAVDGYGNIYIADTYLLRVQVVYSAGTIPNVSNPTVGSIYTIAGNGNSGYNGDGILATSAALAEPQSLAVDANGNIYIADNYNNRVRAIYSSGVLPNVSNPVVGDIYTVAGTGACCYNGDNQLATSAQLSRPMGVAVDGYGDIYIADTNNNRIREVAAGTGMISTVAGYGAQGYNGDNQLAIVAQLNIPEGIAVDASGAIYIVDSRNNRIRKVINGNITTVAGNGTEGYNGDGILGANAEINTEFAGDQGGFFSNDTYELGASGVAIDPSGNIYFTDVVNNRVRVIGGQLTMSTFNPLYKVTSILYAPPGNQSSQGYGLTTTNGTTTTVGSSFTASTQMSFSVGVPAIFTAGGSVGYSVTSNNNFAFTETFTNTTGMTTGDNSSTTFNPTSSNAVNHNLDTFEIWLNPLVTVESNGSTPVAYTVASTPITVNGVPLPFSDIVGVPAITLEASPAGVTALNPSGIAGITTVAESLLAPIRIPQSSGVDAYMPGLGAVCAGNQLYPQELVADLAAEAAGTNRSDSYCTQGNQCGCTPNDFAEILLTDPLLFANSSSLTVTNVQGGTWGSTSSPGYYVLVTFSGNTPPVVNSTPNWYTFSGLTSYTALNGQTLSTAAPSPVGATNPLPTPAANQAVFSFGSTVFGPAADTGQALLPGAVSPYPGTVSPLQADSLPTSSGLGSGPVSYTH